jgi:hypothetical protein
MMVKLMNGEKIEPQLEYEGEKMYMIFVEEGVVNFSEFMNLLSKKRVIRRKNVSKTNNK